MRHPRDGARAPSASGSYLLVAEDDEENFILLKNAWSEVARPPIERVPNGERLLQRLERDAAPPSLVLLDLDMPIMDGFETLRRLKTSVRWRELPVVVFSGTANEEDVYLSYALGANSFIGKPARYQRMVAVLRSVHEYWFGSVTLPARGRPAPTGGEA